jgi:ABC-type transport system involved in multi-copper enzyme maturation permease subunit
MLRTIIKKEIRDALLSPRFLLGFFICTILTFLSVLIGLQSYGSELRDFDMAQALSTRELASRTTPDEVLQVGIKIHRRPTPLIIFVNGIASDSGRTQLVRTDTDPQAMDSKYEADPVTSIFRNLDLAEVVRLALSLFALLFTYDAIAGEKERGTLGLMLSNSVAREQVLLGKALGSFICLVLAFTVPFILGVLTLAFQPDLSLARGDWLRVGCLFIISLLYILVFLSAGIFISSRAHRSSNSLFLSLVFWFFVVIIIPKVAVLCGSRFHRVPSNYENTFKKNLFYQNLAKESQDKTDAFMLAFPPPAEEKARNAWGEKSLKFYAQMREEQLKKLEEYADMLERQYQIERKAQYRIAKNLARISPASSLMFASMGIAGTGPDDKEGYLRSVRSYSAIWRRWIEKKSMERIALQSANANPLTSDMPRFSYSDEDFSAAFLRIIPDVGILVVMIIFFFAGAYWSFARYDAR